SMPVSVGNAAGGSAAGAACDSDAGRYHVSALAFSGAMSVSDAATIDAILARSGVTSPAPSGCTRLDRKITKTLVAGSIQIDVPVKPVWPNEPMGRKSPRFAE